MNTGTQHYKFMVSLIPWILIVVILAAILGYIVHIFIPFSKKHRYIKMEMNRTRGKEYRYWEKELKRCYIRLIPVVGKTILKHSK